MSRILKSSVSILERGPRRARLRRVEIINNMAHINYREMYFKKNEDGRRKAKLLRAQNSRRRA